MKQAFGIALFLGFLLPLSAEASSPEPSPRIAAGEAHTCAVTSDGKVWCWGRNGRGQLGNGTTEDSSTPVSVRGLSEAIAIAAGDEHTCTLTSAGKVWCWGANDDGQLGNGTTKSSSTPVSVRGLSDAVAIAAGVEHTCALTTSGTVKCWGYNGLGQLGNGTTEYSSTPVSVRGLSDAIAIAAGWRHTCALTSAGKVWCWGDNRPGQLGNGTTEDSSTPVSVRGLSDAVAIAAGGFHTCALTSAGKVWCWGGNNVSQLGIGTSTGPETCTDDLGDFACSTTPVSVQGLSDAVAVAAGGYHTCALTTSGTVKCWGWNYYGQLGNGTSDGPEKCGTYACSTTPVSVRGLSDAIAIAAGGEHTCALASAGKVWCWGKNDSGHLGIGTYSGPEKCGEDPCSTTPVAAKLGLR